MYIVIYRYRYRLHCYQRKSVTIDRYQCEANICVMVLVGARIVVPRRRLCEAISRWLILWPSALCAVLSIGSWC